MLATTIHREFAAALHAAERDRVWIDPLTELHGAAEIADAYAIAQAVTALKLAEGRSVKGHKIGLTSAVMREVSGANEPDYGTLFDNWFVNEGDTLSRSLFNRPFVELELAFVLKTALTGPAVNVADVIRATDFVLPAIEIVDSRYTRRGPGKVVIDSIADAAWCGRIVLGGNPRRLDQIDIRTIGASLLKSGEVVASGVSSAVMGNPLNAVAWLANTLHGFDVPLEAGHVIMSGSFIKVFPFDAGDEIVARFDELGDVAFSVTA
jgi:2-keto-4-pentenoate hydratase